MTGIDEDAATEPRGVLDAAIRGKEHAAGFFHSLAAAVDEVDLRRCFRRLAQEEWDHRKILLKHRRSLYGRPAPGPAAGAAARGGDTAFAPLAARRPIRSADDLREALRTAIRSERDAHAFFADASRRFADRDVQVFLRILAREGLAQVGLLEQALDRARGDVPIRRRPPAREVRETGPAGAAR